MFERLLGNVKGVFNVITILELIMSMICILVGLVFFTSFNLNQLLKVIIISLIIICFGVISLYSYLKRNNVDLFNYNIFYGIVFLLIGIVSLFVSRYSLVFLGIYLIFEGIKKINYGILLKKFHESSWLITLVIGILFFGISIFSFFAHGDKVTNVIGINLIGFGLINTINLMLLRRRSEYFLT